MQSQIPAHALAHSSYWEYYLENSYSDPSDQFSDSFDPGNEAKYLSRSIK